MTLEVRPIAIDIAGLAFFSPAPCFITLRSRISGNIGAYEVYRLDQ